MTRRGVLAVTASPGFVLRSTDGNLPPVGFPAQRVRPARRSAALLLTLGLSLSTALVLLGAGTALSQPPVAVSPASDHREVVGRFYDAVNLALRTGDGALDEVVAADLVTHDVRSRVDQDRAGFDHHLAALHAADPSLQLLVEEVLVEGDRAAVRLLARSNRTGSFLGVSLDGRAAPWPAIDLLRLAGSRVVERWAVDDAGVVVQPVLQTRLDARSADSGSVGLARLTVAPGASVANVIHSAPALFAVETGTLRVRIDGAALLNTGDPATAPADELVHSVDRTLQPGDALVVAGDARLELRNEAAAPATALGVARTAALARPGGVLGGVRVAGQGQEQAPTLDWPAGVTVQPLAAGSTMSLPAGPVAVAIGRLTLGPRASLPPRAVRGVELLAVEAGRLGFAATGPVAVFRQGRSYSPSPSPNAAASTGAGADVNLTPSAASIAYDGAVASLRNPDDTPVVTWVVTIAPVESGPEAG